MNAKSIRNLAIVAAMLIPASLAPAQDLSQIAAWNMQQDTQFFNWARVGSMRVAQAMPNNVTPNQIIAAMQPHSTGQVYGNYNANWWALQQRQLQAVEGYSRGAIRGESGFVDYYGNRYYLPYGPGGYHYGANGYIYQGRTPVDYGMNIYGDE